MNGLILQERVAVMKGNLPLATRLKRGSQSLMLLVKWKSFHEAAEAVISSNKASVRAENSLRETIF
jgi:hypothetical protein